MTSLAIVGMGCRFPGGAADAQGYWDLLCQGRCAIAQIPSNRWSLERFFDPAPDVPGRSYSKWGGFLEDIKAFDPEFFGLNAREAEAMDPQQRLLLTVAYEAIQDARIPMSQLRQRDTGVFVGLSNADYDHLQRLRAAASDIQAGTGTALSIVANRLSNNLDLGGPSLGVDTACSSSLVALDLATRHLRDGTCDIAIVAGVNIMLDPRLFATFSQAHMLSPTGHIRTFDRNADGFVRGEGVGVVILKRDADARADENRIYALIKATAINQDGATGTITAPNPDAQRRMMHAVLQAAGVDRSVVSYAEAHGTGTVVGDPIEANAIGEVFGGPDRAAALYIGSSKPNLGHLEPAAGIAGLMKAALVLHHRKIPPSIGFDQPNPKIQFDAYRLMVNKESVDLPTPGGQAHALVNSFGFGGTNACALLAAATESKPWPEHSPSHRPSHHPCHATSSLATSGTEAKPIAIAVPLSAPTKPHLTAYAERLRAAVSDGGRLAKCSPRQIGAALAARRDHFQQRALIVATSREDLLDKLTFLAADHPTGRAWPKRDPRDPPGILEGRVRTDRKLVFTMTGQGGQWWSMGRALLERHPVFRETVLSFDAIFKAAADWSVVDVLMADEAQSPIDDAAITPAVMFAFQIGLAAVWRSVGVRPDIVVGHSFGEVTAAYLAGSLSQATVANLVNQRGLIRGKVDRQGSMAAVGLSAVDVATYLPTDGSIEIGGYNAPHMVTLTGDEAAIDALIATVQADDPTTLARKLALDFAYHSSWFEPVEQRFMADVGELETSTPALPVISTVTGELNTSFGADYWWRNLRYPVRYQAAIETALAMGGNTFVELGPHRTLSSMTAGCAANQGQSVLTVSTLYRQWDDFVSLASALGELYVNGIDIDWPGVFGTDAAPDIDLPNQPWLDRPLWTEPRETARILRPAFWHPLLGTLDEAPNAQWSNTLNVAQHSYLRDHVISGQTLFPAAAYIDMLVTAARHVFRANSIELLHVNFLEALDIGGGEDFDVRTIFNRERNRFEIYARSHSAADDHRTGEWRLHAQCTARARDFALPPARDRLDATAVNPDDFYAKARQAGYDYGPAFKGLTDIQVGANCAFGRARNDTTTHIDTKTWRLNPCLLDACFQLMIPLRGEGGLCLPVSIDRVVSTGPLASDVTADLARAPQTKAADGIYNLHVRADGGEHGLVLERLCTRQMPSSAQPADQERFAIEAYEPATDRSGNLEPLAMASILLFAAPATVEARQLEAPYRQVGAEVLVHDIGSGHADTWEADRRAIRQWLQSSSGSQIIYAPGWSTGPADDLDRIQEGIAGQTKRLIAWGRALASLTDDLTDVRIVVVSHQARDIGQMTQDKSLFLEHSTLPAIARAIALECPTLDIQIVDTDGRPASATNLVRWAGSASGEREVILRQGAAWVPRLKERPPQTWHPRRAQPSALSSDLTFAFTQSGRRGRTTPSWRAIAKGTADSDQVVVRVTAAGLNFRDVMAVNGMLPDDAEADSAGNALGLEFAGVITHAPAGDQDFELGQRVFGLARGALRGNVVVDKQCLFPIPNGITMQQAATLPSAYLTAHYALTTLGRLEAGQWVLIHSGAGGLGLAAVHIAKAQGARIIATAGNEAKRAYLRTLGVDAVEPSRTLDFVEKVTALTDGLGVDLVMNALPGDFVTAGLECLAPYGHFIELGKRDIYADRAIGLKALRRNISFHVVDVAALIQDRPDRVRQSMGQVLEQIARGILPTLPVTAYPASEADAAFRYFAAAEHIGKIALELDDTALTVEVDQEATFNRNGSILITGGSSSIAHALARAFAARGDRQIVLASRRAQRGEAFENLQRDCRTLGCDVQAVQLDVTDKAATERLVATLASASLPLRGIIHAAVEYADALLMDSTPDKIDTVLAPKVKGASNLSEAVLASGCTIDFFVSFSSMAQVVGWPGQTSYAAANAFLESFVPWQRQRGIPAYCINWGVFAQSGQVARDERLSNYMTRAGWRGLADDVIARRLVEVIASDEPVVSIYDADWREIMRNNAPLASSSRLADVKQVASVAVGATGATSLGQLQGEARREQAESLVLNAIADVVRSDVEALAQCDQLNDAGIDSLSMFELRLQLERNTGLVVPLSRFVEASTITELTTLLCTLADTAGD